MRDGELPYLSPSWVLNKLTKAFVGITSNVGGLVPSSAFHTMQAFAKGGSGSAVLQDTPFMRRVRAVMEEKGCDGGKGL